MFAKRVPHAFIFLFLLGCEPKPRSTGVLFPMASSPQSEGFINERGEFVIPAVYEFARPFYDGLAAVSINGKWGFINPEGEMVIPPVFDELGPIHYGFSEGLAAVKRQDMWGYIDIRGNEVIPFRFLHADHFCGGRTSVNVGEQEGERIIDMSGNWVGETEFDRILDFCEGLAPVKKNGKWGYVDVQGVVQIQPEYESAGHYSAGYASVRLEKQGPWYLIDRQGQTWAGPYELIGPFTRSGLAGVKTREMAGFIDLQGKVVLRPEWKEIGPFYEGLAAVKGDGWSGYINALGEVVIRFDEVIWLMGIFENGLASLATTREEGYINRRGEKVYWRKKRGT